MCEEKEESECKDFCFRVEGSVSARGEDEARHIVYDILDEGGIPSFLIRSIKEAPR